MRVVVLGSGSKGNSIFIEDNNFRILIDAGFSGKKTVEKLDKINVAPDSIGAILITHEHGDHINGAGVFSRKYKTPIFITQKSLDYGFKKIGKVNDDNLNIIDRDFEIGSKMLIKPFKVMHDASLTIGFEIINKNKKKLAIATDIGYTTNSIKERFKNSDVIIIESNYNYNMLLNGSYPWDLKMRVKSRNGHLSNEDCSRLVKSVYSNRLKKVFLAHVSQENNTYDLALKETKEFLLNNNIDLDLEVCFQDKLSNKFIIE